MTQRQDTAGFSSPLMDISVIMPTYNCLPWLPRALYSIRRQGTVREILIIDDGSSDGTLPWLQQQPDIVLLQTKRLGAGGARNQAIREAKGEWLAFLDADDYWLRDKLKRQYQALAQHPEAVMSITDFRHMSNDGQNLGRCYPTWPYFSAEWRKKNSTIRHAVLFPELYQENFIGTSTVVVRRQVVLDCGGFDTTLRSASDWDLWLKVAKQGPLLVMPFVGMHYWMERPGSITQGRQLRIDAMKTILQRHGRQYPLRLRHRMRAYQRWYEGKAQQKREEKSKLAAIFYELITWLLWPQYRILKRIGKDLLP